MSAPQEPSAATLSLARIGRFAPKFSEDQKAALLALVLDDDGPRLPMKRAVAAAKAGEIPGVEAFHISEAYAYELKRREERLRAGEGARAATPEQRLRTMKGRMTTALDASLRAYESKLRRANRSPNAKPPGPQTLVTLARAGQEIAKLGGAINAPAPYRSPSPTRGKGKAPNSQLEAMLREHERTAGDAIPACASAERTRPRGTDAYPGPQQHQDARTSDALATPREPRNDNEPTELDRAKADFRRALAAIEP